MLLISGRAWFEVAYWQWDNHRWWFWTDLGLGALGFVLVAWRRRFPVPVAADHQRAVVRVVVVGRTPATLALVSLSTRRRWREIIPVGVLLAGRRLRAGELQPGQQRRLRLHPAVHRGHHRRHGRLGHVHRLTPRAARDAPRARPHGGGGAGRARRPGAYGRAGSHRPRDARRAGPPHLARHDARGRLDLPRGPHRRGDASDRRR